MVARALSKSSGKWITAQPCSGSSLLSRSRSSNTWEAESDRRSRRVQRTGRCYLLGDWICETHCAEIQAEGGSATRLAIASQIGWKLAPELLRNGCRCCPYSQGTSAPLRPNSL